ncbi:hypothetical protein [Streptomyces sp. CBMA156]|uniref:hypothetical protein n=1 Tax=Streptomyces sp. CBMA156 TaxID=1930280 RepID=UPI001661C08D|nr:hypothetical protein [Streptomyces sp. CBMA156]MBD0669751.1 hypothetical protein [Streptomyces sp. CBMA156]
MTTTRWTRRRTLAASATTAIAVGLLGLGTAPAAHADTLPTLCNPTVDHTVTEPLNLQITPLVTDFLIYNVTPGSVGQHSDVLNRVSSATTTVDNRTEITAGASALFAKVEVKVGFSVQKTTSSTVSQTVSDTWTLKDPGRYGLYRGTRVVSGQYVNRICAQTGPTTGVWVTTSSTPGTFTTYEAPEIGSVGCAPAEPAGTVRRAAQLLLSSC